MKNLYIALTVEENGKYYSWVRKEPECNNLASIFKDIPGLSTANVWPKNKAYETVKMWNEAYKNNGTYLYDETF